MGTNLSKLPGLLLDREGWHAAVRGVQRVRHNWVTELGEEFDLVPTMELGGWTNITKMPTLPEIQLGFRKIKAKCWSENTVGLGDSES